MAAKKKSAKRRGNPRFAPKATAKQKSAALARLKSARKKAKAAGLRSPRLARGKLTTGT